MKNSLVGLIALILLLASCVQPTRRYEVEFELMIPMGSLVENISIQGADYPLSWEEATPLKRRDSDSLYTVKVAFQTGYLYTEYKYKMNGVYELKEQDNRRIQFKEGQTTYLVRDTFDLRK